MGCEREAAEERITIDGEYQEDGYVYYINNFDGEEFEYFKNVANRSNNQEELESNWKEFRNRQGLTIPPNIPTEDPSSNPIPKEPEWSSINTYPDHPPEWEPYWKELESHGGILGVSKEQLYSLRKKYWLPLDYDGSLPNQYYDMGYNPNADLESRLAKTLLVAHRVLYEVKEQVLFSWTNFQGWG